MIFSSILSHRNNALARTALQALEAAYAFFIIYCGEVVVQLYSARGAHAFALAATDTADLAHVHHFLALGRVGARYVQLGGFGYPAYYLFGARGNAPAARRTVFPIHLGCARILANSDGVRLAGVYARAKPHTAVLARLVPARKHLRAFTIAESLILELIRRAVTARAMHDCDGFFALHRAHAQDPRDVLFVLGRRGVATGNIRFALEKRFGKLRAPCIAATAAICAGEVALYVVYARIALHRQFVAEIRQAKREQRRKRRYYQYRNYYL